MEPERLHRLREDDFKIPENLRPSAKEYLAQTVRELLPEARDTLRSPEILLRKTSRGSLKFSGECRSDEVCRVAANSNCPS